MHLFVSVSVCCRFWCLVDLMGPKMDGKQLPYAQDDDSDSRFESEASRGHVCVVGGKPWDPHVVQQPETHLPPVFGPPHPRGSGKRLPGVARWRWTELPPRLFQGPPEWAGPDAIDREDLTSLPPRGLHQNSASTSTSLRLVTKTISDDTHTWSCLVP